MHANVPYVKEKHAKEVSNASKLWKTARQRFYSDNFTRLVLFFPTKWSKVITFLSQYQESLYLRSHGKEKKKLGEQETNVCFSLK